MTMKRRKSKLNLNFVKLYLLNLKNHKCTNTHIFKCTYPLQYSRIMIYDNFNQ